jgi:hypothetical protein
VVVEAAKSGKSGCPWEEPGWVEDLAAAWVAPAKDDAWAEPAWPTDPAPAPAPSGKSGKGSRSGSCKSGKGSAEAPAKDDAWAEPTWPEDPAPAPAPSGKSGKGSGKSGKGSAEAEAPAEPDNRPSSGSLSMTSAELDCSAEWSKSLVVHAGHDPIFLQKLHSE